MDVCHLPPPPPPRPQVETFIFTPFRALLTVPLAFCKGSLHRGNLGVRGASSDLEGSIKSIISYKLDGLER